MVAKSKQMAIRFEPGQAAALERAAKEDDREPSALARKIVVDWLVRKGWIVPEMSSMDLWKAARE